jgi:hypothetical protein
MHFQKRIGFGKTAIGAEGDKEDNQIISYLRELAEKEQEEYREPGKERKEVMGSGKQTSREGDYAKKKKPLQGSPLERVKGLLQHTHTRSCSMDNTMRCIEPITLII